jgi:hypothetical protein
VTNAADEYGHARDMFNSATAWKHKYKRTDGGTSSQGQKENFLTAVRGPPSAWVHCVSPHTCVYEDYTPETDTCKGGSVHISTLNKTNSPGTDLFYYADADGGAVQVDNIKPELKARLVSAISA